MNSRTAKLGFTKIAQPKNSYRDSFSYLNHQIVKIIACTLIQRGLSTLIHHIGTRTLDIFTSVSCLQQCVLPEPQSITPSPPPPQPRNGVI